MQSLVVDTNGVVKKLEEHGFSRTQAEGITEALKELDTTALATKADLEDAVKTLQIAINQQAVTMMKWVTGILVAQGGARRTAPQDLSSANHPRSDHRL